jgi:hypothetical protein
MCLEFQKNAEKGVMSRLFNKVFHEQVLKTGINSARLQNGRDFVLLALFFDVSELNKNSLLPWRRKR